ncbi:MAG: hypothetical protein AAGC55_14475, partial [Myxococcota bacterium]
VPSGLDSDLERALQGVVVSKAPDLEVASSSGKQPTKAQLRRSKTKAYMVGTQISALQIRKKGNSAEVACTVSIRVNPWEGKGGKERWTANQTAQAKGAGKVTGSGTSRGIANSTRDCVLAVAEQVAAQQIVPFLRRVAATQ